MRSEGPEQPTPEVLDRTTVVLNQPQDLVNIALVIRAMKNMGLARLRLVRPREFDTYRIQGIAHDTREVVEAIEIFDDLPSALADSTYVLAATARRRSTRQDWWSPHRAATELTRRDDRFALLFGQEDHGLSNEHLDLCHGLIQIPTNPDHSSLNIGHAAVIIFYEWRRAAMRGSEDAGDIAFKRQTPPATHDQLEDFFGLWRTAMDEIGMFSAVDPVPKMRSFRALFQRAELDSREVGLVQATAYEIINFARRERKRALRAATKTSGESESSRPTEDPHRPV